MRLEAPDRAIPHPGQTRRPARTGGAAGVRSRPRPPVDSGCPALVRNRGPATNRGQGVPDWAVSCSEADETTGAGGRDHWNAVAALARAPGGLGLSGASGDPQACRQTEAGAPGGAVGRARGRAREKHHRD
ncbi:hypothetical protein NDU88_007173 [Pleurodeles waltl]|uniref:Uncharacterized protein n=1 Tax=Pleurodeles waltl TaxID=8319 RepID=A0AAV7RS76_PLEWA|nr:hypothetical protein NDU88_007173 [Pleurodeles waltl]